MTGTDFCVNKPHMSRSYLNHLVFYYHEFYQKLTSKYILTEQRTLDAVETITDCGSTLVPLYV